MCTTGSLCCTPENNTTSQVNYKVKVKSLSRVQLFVIPWTPRLLHPWDLLGNSTGVGYTPIKIKNVTLPWWLTHLSQLLSPRAWSPCSATRGTTTVRRQGPQPERSPCLPQVEKACVQLRRPSIAKQK